MFGIFRRILFVFLVSAGLLVVSNIFNNSVFANHQYTCSPSCTRSGAPVTSGACPAASDGYTGQACSYEYCCLANGATFCTADWTPCNNGQGSVHERSAWGCPGCSPTATPVPAATPTPTPLPCTTSYSHSCTNGGTTLNLDWADIPGAGGGYAVRVPKQGCTWFSPACGDLNGTPAVSNLSLTVEPGATYTWDVQGIKSGEPYPQTGCRGPFQVVSCPLPTNTPTPTRTPTPLPNKVWNITVNPICANGSTATNIRTHSTVWPPNPLVWTTSGYSSGSRVITMNSTSDYSGSGYIHAEHSSGADLDPTSASNVNINTTGTYFSPATEMATWNRASLPAGSYSINFAAPAAACPTPTPTNTPTPVPPTATPVPVCALTASLTTSPTSGNAPLNGVDMTGVMGGTGGGTGTIRYRFDCTNDGVYDLDSTVAATSYTYVDGCSYSGAGTYTAKVRIDRGTCNAQNTATVTVVVGPTPTFTPTPLPPTATPVPPTPTPTRTPTPVPPTATPTITPTPVLGGSTISATPGCGLVILNWTAATGTFNEYHVRRCTGVGCSTYADITTTTLLTYQDTTVTNGTTYQYQVRTHNHTTSTYGPTSNTAVAVPVCPTATPTPVAPTATLTPTPDPLATATPTPVGGGGPSWWQAQGGNVYTLGDIACSLPTGEKLVETGALAKEGTVVSATAVANLGSGTASAANWLVGSALDLSGGNFVSTTVLDKYDFEYFRNRISALASLTDAGTTYTGPEFLTFVDSVPTASDGFKYISAGDLTISSGFDLENRDVVVVSTGNVTLGGSVSLTDNQGVFVVVASGDINVGTGVGSASYTTVAHLEGIFVSNNFNTGISSNYLRIEGVVVAYTKVNFQRTVGGSEPVEYFSYRPDLVMNMPKGLLRQSSVWQEVAP